MGTLTVAVIALIIAVWHELNRFPAAGKSMIAMQNIVNYFHQNNSDKKMVKHLKDGIQKCVTQTYDMSPIGGVQADGSFKLW